MNSNGKEYPIYTVQLSQKSIAGKIKNGHWDVCDGNPNQASRIGDYFIINTFIEK